MGEGGAGLDRMGGGWGQTGPDVGGGGRGMGPDRTGGGGGPDQSDIRGAGAPHHGAWTLFWHERAL